MRLFELMQEYPFVAATVTAGVAGCVPVFNALQRAAIRRIDKAWPDDDPNLSHDQKIDHTVKTLSNSIVPNALVTTAIRRHKKKD